MGSSPVFSGLAQPAGRDVLRSLHRLQACQPRLLINAAQARREKELVNTDHGNKGMGTVEVT